MSIRSKTLTREEADAFGRELDAIRDEIVADLGQRDVDHIRRVIARCALRTRRPVGCCCTSGSIRLSFVAGVAALALAKILENMEIGHNVMHGQYDWTRDPALDSHRYEWDIVCTGDDWRHSHNYEHHTFTNILGKDRDIGYALAARLPRAAVASGAPRAAAGGARPGVRCSSGASALHDLRIDELLDGKQSLGALSRGAPVRS